MGDLVESSLNRKQKTLGFPVDVLEEETKTKYLLDGALQ